MPLVLNNDGNIEKKDDKHEFVKHAEAEKAHEEARLQADDKDANADDWVEANAGDDELECDELPPTDEERVATNGAFSQEEYEEARRVADKTPKEVVKAVAHPSPHPKPKSKLKRKKSGFRKEEKKKASSVASLPYTEATAKTVSALCYANDKVEEYTAVASAYKEELGRIALDNWYANGDASIRIEGLEISNDEAVVSVKEKTTGNCIVDLEALESVLDAHGHDINTMVEERTTLKIDTKIIDKLDDRGGFIEALQELADKFGVGAAITEVTTEQPTKALHEVRRAIGANYVIEGNDVDMEEILPIITSVNTKVKRK